MDDRTYFTTVHDGSIEQALVEFDSAVRASRIEIERGQVNVQIVIRPRTLAEKARRALPDVG